MQNIQRLPWECQSDYDATIEVLTSMGSALTHAFRKTSTVEEAMASANFEDYWPNLKQYGPDTASQVSLVL